MTRREFHHSAKRLPHKITSRRRSTALTVPLASHRQPSLSKACWGILIVRPCFHLGFRLASMICVPGVDERRTVAGSQQQQRETEFTMQNQRYYFLNTTLYGSAVISAIFLRTLSTFRWCWDQRRRKKHNLAECSHVVLALRAALKGVIYLSGGLLDHFVRS